MRALVALLVFSSLAHAGRPPEAIDSDRAAAEAEVADLERRAAALEDQIRARRDHLRRRLHAAYKMANGGMLRVLAGAQTIPELATRHEATRRILARDLEELAAVREEASELDREHARRAEQLARALDLERQYASASDEPSVGLARKQGRLLPPVSGDVLGRFGRYRDAELHLDVSRRGLELSSHPGELVRAVAAGRVRWIGDLAGFGRTVAVDHGDGYVSLTGRLRNLKVQVGDTIRTGTYLADASGSRIYFELAQGRTALDPSRWLVLPR